MRRLLALTPTGLSVRNALGENGDEAPAIFEGALDVERRSWLELITCGHNASAPHYDVLGTA
jgi:hypothetical protein